MGSICLAVPITASDINIENLYVCSDNFNSLRVSRKFSESEQCESSEIQLTSHSDDENSDNYEKRKLEMIGDSPKKQIKSILKKSQSIVIQPKTVTFCCVSPTLLQSMKESQGKLSEAQKAFLDSLNTSF